MLEDRVDVAVVGRDAGDRPAGQQDLALGRLLEAGDHPQRRRLAAARRAEQAGERAVRDPQRHPVDGDDVPEPLRDVEELDVRGVLGRSRGSSSGWRAAGGRGGRVAVSATVTGPLLAGRIVLAGSSVVALLQGAPMVRGARRQRQRGSRSRFESTQGAIRGDEFGVPRSGSFRTSSGLQARTPRASSCARLPRRTSTASSRRDARASVTGRSFGSVIAARRSPRSSELPGAGPLDRAAVHRGARARSRRSPDASPAVAYPGLKAVDDS